MKFIRFFIRPFLPFILWPINKIFVDGTHRSRVLIECKGKLLFVRGWNQTYKYSIPGGGRKKYESAEVCAVREIKEELGISLHTDDLKPLGEIQHEHNGIKFVKDAFYVHLKKEPPITYQAIEILEHHWLPIHDVPTEQLSTSSQVHYKKYLEAIS